MNNEEIRSKCKIFIEEFNSGTELLRNPFSSKVLRRSGPTARYVHHLCTGIVGGGIISAGLEENSEEEVVQPEVETCNCGESCQCGDSCQCGPGCSCSESQKPINPKINECRNFVRELKGRKQRVINPFTGRPVLRTGVVAKKAGKMCEEILKV
jgi:hypothetical protein